MCQYHSQYFSLSDFGVSYSVKVQYLINFHDLLVLSVCVCVCEPCGPFLTQLDTKMQAVEATKNVELGNKELSQAIQRNSSSRTFLLLFLFVLTFSVLFLDWYS